MALDTSPLYIQLASQLAQGIRDGSYALNHALPSERMLCESMGVSRITARKAIDRLVDQGLVQRRHGSGNFIAARAPQGLTHLSSFSEQMAAGGQAPDSHWLLRSSARSSAEERKALELAPTARVARLQRLRLADGLPVALEHTAIPLSLLPRPQALEGSLYAWLEQQGHAPQSAQQRLRAVNADAEQARLLQLPAGSALLWVTRCSRDAAGLALELTHTWCRSDCYDYAVELHRTPQTK
jgi:GntR family transcriptional regulator